MSAPTIVATAGAADANSYSTLDAADAYFADGLDADRWDAFSDEQRARALISATRAIDSTRLRGDPSSTSQALHFPQADDENSDAIPAAVQAATCEQALWLLEQRETPELLNRRALQHQGVTQVAMDGISETYGGRAGALCPEAEAHLSGYGMGAGTKILTRGNG